MISGIMELWNADKALMQYGYTLDAMLAQQQTIKQRLFVLISTGQFDAIHDKLCRFTKKKMKYKWRPYNTVLWLILKSTNIYGGCKQYCHWSLYFNTMCAPEAKAETAFSILKLLLSKNSELKLQDINYKFQILSFFKHEFAKQCLDFLKQISLDYLVDNRAPITQYSKKKWGTVLDRLLNDDTFKVDVILEADDDKREFSESDDDDDEQEAMNDDDR
eukprot:343536_1